VTVRCDQRAKLLFRLVVPLDLDEVDGLIECFREFLLRIELWFSSEPAFRIELFQVVDADHMIQMLAIQRTFSVGRLAFV